MGDRRLRRALRLPRASVLLLVPVGLGFGALVAVLQPPMYSSTVLLYTNTASGVATSDAAQADGAGVTPIAPRPGVVGDLASNGYAGLATATATGVLDPVIQQLGLRTTATELADHVRVDTATGSVVTTISVDDRSPAQAAAVANAIASRVRGEVARVELGGSAPRSTATVVSRAVPDHTPILPDLPLDSVFGAAGGLALAGAVTGVRAERRRTEPRGAVGSGELVLLPARGLFEDRRGLR